MRIKEWIVVEGRSDTVAVQRAVDADTIETGGSAIGEAVIERIRLAQAKRGVILLTDPDYAGERIRHVIDRRVPGCKHAFLPREEAMTHGGIGVEHASPAAIRSALRQVQTVGEAPEETFDWAELNALGLIGGAGAKEKRQMLGRLLRIGYANGRQFHKRLNRFQIRRDELYAALAQIEQEGSLQ